MTRNGLGAVVATVCLLSGCNTNGNSNGALGLGGVSISQVSPNTGPAAGGTAITLTGSGFVAGATSLTIGAQPATSLNVLSATQLTAVTPAGALGATSVTVSVAPTSSTSRGGLFTLPAGFTYTASGSGSGQGNGNGGSGSSSTVAFAGGPRQSSPVAVSADGTTLVNVNPDSNTVSVFDVTSDSPKKLAEIPVGLEPRSVAIAPLGTAVYVANAVSGNISVIDLSIMKVTATIPVGVEPMAVCLTPAGSTLYVANEISNDLWAINTANNAVITSTSLAAFGTHPRALAITNSNTGNDKLETVFVAMFFGAMRPGHTFLDEGQDDQREGHVVSVPVATNTPSGPIALSPLAPGVVFPGGVTFAGGTGFKSNGSVLPQVQTVNGVGVAAPAPTNPAVANFATGAFPNQLAAIAISPITTAAYVVSTGASPNGPFAFNVNNQGLVSMFDTVNRVEIASANVGGTIFQQAPLNLDQGVLQDSGLTPKLFYSNPVAMAWRPNGADAWIVAQQGDVVVRMTANANGIPTIGGPTANTNAGSAASIIHVDLDNPPSGGIAGNAPRGIAINRIGTRAYVYCFTSRSISVLDITNGKTPFIAGTAQASPLPLAGTQAAQVQQGAQLFYSGRGRMSNNAWGACILCHPDGRTDNVTWMFPAGPRQTISLDGSYDRKNPTDHRIFNWSAERDEVQDFELNTRAVFGGQGLIDDDRLFFAMGGSTGGFAGSAPAEAAPATSSSLEIDQYQQATNTVSQTDFLAGNSPLPALLDARQDFATATSTDGKVWIFGGRANVGATSTPLGTLVTTNAVLVYDPRANTLTPVNGSGFTPRYGCSAATVVTSAGPRIYIVGGYTDTTGASLPTTLVQSLNPATGAAANDASFPTQAAGGGIAFFGMTAAGGANTAEPNPLIHVIDGTQGHDPSLNAANLAGNVLQLVWTFTPNGNSTGTWSAASTITGQPAVAFCGAATVLRGATSHIFVIGGLNASGVPQSEVFDYVAQTLAPVATTITQLPAPLWSFGIGSSLSTNQIYCVGGLTLSAAGSAIDTGAILQITPGTNGAVAGALGTPSGAIATVGNLSTPRHGLGLSSPVPVTNFAPVSNAGRSAGQDAIALWVADAVRPNVGLTSVLPTASVANGRALFNTPGLSASFPNMSCASCHGGPKWTRSTVDFVGAPSPDGLLSLVNPGPDAIAGNQLALTFSQPQVLFDVGTFHANGGGVGGNRINEVRFNAADPSQILGAVGANGFNIPSLLSVGQTGPWFYNGSAQTLVQVLNGTIDQNAGTPLVAAPFFDADAAGIHHVSIVATGQTSAAQEQQDLVNFLLTIDGNTPSFP